MKAHFLPALCLLTILASPPAHSQSSDLRVFTSKAGQQVKARFIESKGGFVKIERVADRKVFVLETAKLSEEDQVWIRQRALRGSAPKPGAGIGWPQLTIRPSNPNLRVVVVGMDSGVLQIGSRELVLRCPSDAWLRLIFFADNQMLEHLIPYRGASEWQLSADGSRLILSRDGGSPEMVGVTLKHGRPFEELLTPPPGVKRADGISIEVRHPDQHDSLKSLPVRIDAVVNAGMKTTGTALTKMGSLNLKAFLGGVKLRDLHLLGQFSNLECLRLGLQELPSKRNDQGNNITDPVSFPRLPALRSLFIQCAHAPPDFLDTLHASAPRLKVFEFEVASSRAAFEEWTGLDRFQHLEGLSVGRAIRLSAKEVARLPKLTQLYFGPTCIKKNDPDLDALAKRRNLQILNPSHPDFAPEFFDQWAGNGGLVNLSMLQTYRAFEFSRLPNLESLTLRQRKINPDSYDFAQVGSLSRLRYLTLYEPDQDQVDLIAQLPNRDRIEALNLHLGSYTSIAPLTSLSSLRRLHLLHSDGQLTQLDLGAFPKLEFAKIFGQSQLESIGGIPGHPSLEILELARLPLLRDLGEPTPNDRFKTLSIESCSSLLNLDAFSQHTGLKVLALARCDSLVEPLPVLDTNDLDFLNVAHCDQLIERLSDEHLPLELQDGM